MERIAIETEEDYQKLTRLLESFGVEVHRPLINDENNFGAYMLNLENGLKWFQHPPMNPRDELLVAGQKLFVNRPWGECYVDFYDHIIEKIQGQVFHIKDFPDIKDICGPSITRVGKDLYIDGVDVAKMQLFSKYFPEYRIHHVKTGGHSDAVYCPVKPGLIVSLKDVPTYEHTFPGWEVVYLPYQHWEAVKSWSDLKAKNQGRWWIPGEEKNDDLVEFVNVWLDKWVGYVEETVFDINMLVIDEHNVICNNYNEQTFRAFERHNVTPHVCNFRHRYFWDGGLHCISLDLNRAGDMVDYHVK